jgi:hypothetical protein
MVIQFLWSDSIESIAVDQESPESASHKSHNHTQNMHKTAVNHEHSAPPPSLDHYLIPHSSINRSINHEKIYILTNSIGYNTHCAAHHEDIHTQKGMIDMTIWAMWQVKCHFLIREVIGDVQCEG